VAIRKRVPFFVSPSFLRRRPKRDRRGGQKKSGRRSFPFFSFFFSPCFFFEPKGKAREESEEGETLPSPLFPFPPPLSVSTAQDRKRKGDRFGQNFPSPLPFFFPLNSSYRATGIALSRRWEHTPAHCSFLLFSFPFFSPPLRGMQS